MATESPQKYPFTVLSLIPDIKPYADNYFSTLELEKFGISSTAIYGCILEEWNDRFETDFDLQKQIAADGWAYSYSTSNTHNEILEDHRAAQALYDAAGVYSPSKHHKFANKSLLDVGVGNIQITTAIGLLEDYLSEYESSDPLGLGKYKDDYPQLIQDLLDSSDLSTTVAFTTLMVGEAADWLSKFVTNWDEMSEKEKEGLVVYYYNVGGDFMSDKWFSSFFGSGFYLPDPYETPIAQEFIINKYQIERILEELDSVNVQEFPDLVISNSLEASEGETLYFKVSIEGGAVDHDITFQATTFQGTTSNFNPDGSSPDYNGVNGTWTIEAGETHVLIPIQTDEDNVHEGTETLELHVTAIEGASKETLVAIGTIIDDDPAGPSFEAANFSTDLSSVLATADYTLSHDGVGDQENVVVTAYVDTNRNGIWDSGDAQVGYENAYNLRDDENDNEEIELTGLRDHLGDQTLFLTVKSDEVEEHVIVTDEVTVEAVDVNFTLDDFEWTPAGSETRVDYDISHDLDGDVSGVRVRWYADTNGNGTWDDSDDYLGYESAGTLRDGEVDSEGETLEDLGDYDGQGDVFIFTTIEADGIEEFVHREDVVDMGGNDGPDIDLSIEDITFREDRLLSDGQDVRADFVVVNSGSESTAGMDERTGIFWSADDHFDFNDDMMIDYDTHGTLYAGERDSEYERTHYEDIPEGQGYLFYVVDPLDMIAETNEMNNISDAYMVWVL